MHHPDSDNEARPGAQESGFAHRAARMSRPNALQGVSTPGSREDFLRALQLLGADPRILRLHNHRRELQMTNVHLSCSQDDWTKVFGEPQSVEEVRFRRPGQPRHLWKQFCSDGHVTCTGHLFEQARGSRWVVLTRVALV